MSVLITGGTGFVGKHLVSHLDDCYVTTRNVAKAEHDLKDQIAGAISWDANAEPLDLRKHQFDAVVNLMGESIAEGRWTSAKKQRIRDTRVEGTRRLVDAVLDMPVKPNVLVSASAVGIYGDRGDEFLAENASVGSGFLAEVCHQWEQQAKRIEEHGIRLVLIRIGIVLGESGGALSKMVPIFRWGGGGRLGSGQQFVSWIHINDLVRFIAWSIENSDASGVYNATAPNPVRNIELTKALAETIGRPAILPAPKFGLRLLLGEFADSLLASQRVIPRKSLREGFQFRFAEIRKALKDVL